MKIVAGRTEARPVLAGEMNSDDFADLALLMSAIVEHKRLVLKAEESYFAWRPWMLVLRKLGRLSEPYPPARAWALRRVGSLNDVIAKAR